jgi:hypothetical protein
MPRRPLAAVLLAFAAAAALLAGTAPGARPAVHRAAFRDRAAMVLVDCCNGCWAAFNPRTAGFDTVWRGDVDWRGKVHDFSQESSRPRGTILRDRTQPIAQLDAVTLQPGEHVTLRTAATTRMPLWHSLLVAFDEQVRTPVTVRVTENDGRDRVRFRSCTNVSSDREWQWNFKSVRGPSRPATVEWINDGTKPKPLRNLRLEGEEVAWMDGAGAALRVTWQGYDVRPDGVDLRFTLTAKDGTAAPVVQRVAAQGDGLRITTTGLPAGTRWFTTLGDAAAPIDLGTAPGEGGAK